MSTAIPTPSTAATTSQQPQTTAVPPSWSCDTHRRTHYQQRELKQLQLQLTTLQSELRRITQHWFRTKSDDCFQLLVHICVQILQHGLVQPAAGSATLRLIEDFEFVRLSEVQQLLPPHDAPAATGTRDSVAATTVSEFLPQWVASCLRARCLSRCIQCLVADKELLDTYYQRDVAYVRHSSHATALFVCLTAIQLDQSSLLSQLEPLEQRQRHRRTCSQPNFSVTNRLHVVQEEEQQKDHQVDEKEEQHQQQQDLAATRYQLLRRIKSLPCLYSSHSPSMEKLATTTTTGATTSGAGMLRPRCQTYNNSAGRGARAQWLRDELVPAMSGSSTISNASSSCSRVASPLPRHIQLINCDDIKIWTDQTTRSSDAASVTPPANIPVKKGAQPCLKRASPLNGFLSNLFGSPPVYTRWYHRGLSPNMHDDDDADVGASVLDNFLPVNGRKLDKRHQSSLFEGVSMLDYNQAETTTAQSTAPLDIVGGGNSSSSSNSNHGTQASASYSTTPGSLSSDSQHSNSHGQGQGQKMDNQSLAAFLQMSRYTHNNTDLEKENAHFLISEACITAIEHVKWSRQRGEDQAPGESCPAQPDADIVLNVPYVEQHMTSNGNNSAEAVGLQLISRFSDQQLPKLGDLKWLVSEQDAPQQLLPMPKPSPQQQQQQEQLLLLQEEQASSLMRGTRTWAPPRQQIIFTEHPAASRSQLLTRQQYRCAGCGMHVTKQYQQHFRYCNYLGKYLCTGCHRNQLSAIPAKILQAWDFRCYAVSSFAYRLIEQMYTFPLFHVPDLNPLLYAKQTNLARERRRRQQLKYVRDFISVCRFANREQTLFNAVPTHITSDPDMWSMCDFVDVQNKSMKRSIDELIAISEQHISNCVLCTGRAFVCEYCKSPKLIYRWQRKVQRCGQCGVCSHYNCWKTASGGVCQRCERLQGRQGHQLATSTERRI